MSEFVYLYRGGQQMPGSPEQAQQQMQKWMGWLKDLTARGHIKDPGHPLESTGKIVAGKPKIVTDGPFAEAKDMIGGYTIVHAADLTHAAELTIGCPIFEVGGTVEVRPIMQMG
jgi:hypothetical protein